MAPKIKVPADFGREHINSPVHGNLVLKLRDGHEIKTNSMIMSLNSPVIDNLTTNLTQSSLEMDDFTKEAVDCFVESLYTGEVDSLKKQIFEDVNKMAYVFEVSWLSKRCLNFYKNVVLNFKNNSYQEVLFACEIASRAHYNLKQSSLVGYFVKNLMSRGISKKIFLQRYLADLSERSTRQLAMSLSVAGNNYDMIIMPLISHLSINLKCESLDKNSLYLLENIDSQKLLKDHPILFKDTSSLLMEVTDVSESTEVREVIKNFVQHTTSPNPRTSKCDYVLAETQMESDGETSGHEEFIEVASQTDVEPELILAQAVSGPKYPLLVGDSVHLITLANVLESYIHVCFSFANGVGGLAERYFAFRLENGSFSHHWSYVLDQCTENFFMKRFLKNVPSETVKHWIITKTSTHLIVKCNEVTVLNFNFSADCDYYKREGAKLWLRKPGSNFTLKYSCRNKLFIITKKN